MNWIPVVDGGPRPELMHLVLVIYIHLGDRVWAKSWLSIRGHWINAEKGGPIDGTVTHYAEVTLP